MPLPSFQDRIEILSGFRSDTALQIENCDIERLMRVCESCSGADIEGMVRDAGYFALRENRSVVSVQDLEIAIRMRGFQI